MPVGIYTALKLQKAIAEHRDKDVEDEGNGRVKVPKYGASSSTSSRGLTVHLPDSVKEFIEQEAKAHQVSKSEVVTRIIKKYMGHEEDTEADKPSGATIQQTIFMIGSSMEAMHDQVAAQLAANNVESPLQLASEIMKQSFNNAMITASVKDSIIATPSKVGFRVEDSRTTFINQIKEGI